MNQLFSTHVLGTKYVSFTFPYWLLHYALTFELYHTYKSIFHLSLGSSFNDSPSFFKLTAPTTPSSLAS